MSETKFYDAVDAIKAYLALEYGCGIESVETNESGFITVSSDGFPQLKFKPFSLNVNQFFVAILFGETINKPMSLDELKKIIIKKLSKKIS